MARRKAKRGGRRGKAVKCKNVTVNGRRRKLCWGRNGRLVSNKRA